MTPGERELRQALEARSGTPSPEFRARLSGALEHARPATKLMPAVALVAVLALTIATIGVLVMSRGANRVTHGGPASAPRLETPNPSGTRAYLAPTLEVSAPAAGVVWVLVGDQLLFVSTDQGNSWRQRPMPSGRLAQPQISFINEQEGWVMVGGAGGTQCSFGGLSIWHTTDAGTTWQQILLVDFDHEMSHGIRFEQCKEFISFVDSTHGFVDAWDDNSAPTIYRTGDGGASWSASRLPDPPGFKTYGAGDALRADPVRRFGAKLLVTASGMQPDGEHSFVFQSTDEGATWSYLANTGQPAVLVTASRWLSVRPTLALETLDAGETWHAYRSHYTQAAGVPPRIVFADQNVGYAFVRADIERTVNGGLDWTYLNTPGPNRYA
jgi:photosystem II stability/assembly factor-like uncharacterized protein